MTCAAFSQEERHRGSRRGRSDAVRGDPLHREVLGEVAAADVEADRQPGVGGHRPQRIPMPVTQQRETELLGFAREQDAPMPARRAPFDLGDRGLEVPVGDRHDRDEALRRRLDPVEEPVVVGADARELELGVGERQERLAPEAADVRVERVRPHADLVHVPQARGRVVRGGRHLVHVPRRGRERLGPAGDRGVTDGHDPLRAAEAPGVAPVVIAHDVGGVGLEPRGEPRGPDVARFGDVGVAVDHPSVDRCCHQFPLRLRGRRPASVVGSSSSSSTRRSASSVASLTGAVSAATNMSVRLATKKAVDDGDEVRPSASSIARARRSPARPATGSGSSAR